MTSAESITLFPDATYWNEKATEDTVENQKTGLPSKNEAIYDQTIQHAWAEGKRAHSR
jgi:hypothetical protein